MRILLLALLWLSAQGALAETAPRIESQSANFRAVGVLQGERLSIHISRLEDNAPVKDAVVAVTLRGSRHPALAEADGGYSVSSPDLAVPGAAALQIEVTAGAVHEVLKGTLQVAGAAPAQRDDGSARQYGWWVLNFAVCIAFLWLFSRRKKSAEDEAR